jgi:hypothetical protein
MSFDLSVLTWMPEDPHFSYVYIDGLFIIFFGDCSSESPLCHGAVLDTCYVKYPHTIQ